MAERGFDVAVIGLGAMGAYAVQQLAARGVGVIGIERFGPLHDRGSSHGDSRLTRLGYFEDPAYVPLLRRAYANWRAIERRSGEALLTITGVLQLGKPSSTVIAGVLRACAEHGIPHELLEPEAVRQRYPAFALGDDEVGVIEPEGGFLRPERAIATALKLAGADGAVLHFNERVTAIEADDAGVTIVSAAGSYRARKAVVATGSYVAGLVPALAAYARPIKQVVGWYPSRDALGTALGRMPGFLIDERRRNVFRLPGPRRRRQGRPSPPLSRSHRSGTAEPADRCARPRRHRGLHGPAIAGRRAGRHALRQLPLHGVAGGRLPARFRAGRAERGRCLALLRPWLQVRQRGSAKSLPIWRSRAAQSCRSPAFPSRPCRHAPPLNRLPRQLRPARSGENPAGQAHGRRRPAVRSAAAAGHRADRPGRGRARPPGTGSPRPIARARR